MQELKEVTINAAQGDADSSLLVIYTGGTMGMVQDEKGEYVPFDFSTIQNNIPELHQLQANITVVSFAKPIDSSNMTPEIWVDMAGIIQKNYDSYDGFVILHGTDTMSYSASALSFLLENLSKPVVFTGAQLPIGVLRSDARDNFINSLEIAKARTADGTATVPEVCIFFNTKLFRANRTKKVESSHFDAYKSENYPALAEIGVHIDFKNYYINKPEGEVKVYDKLEGNVGILKLFPGISEDYCKAFLDVKDLKGLVLETYGSGNAATFEWFQSFLNKLTDKGVLIINVSQCDEGKVEQGRYATSSFFNKIGVISGKDITTEAALTKMMFVLANCEHTDAAKLLGEPLRGEMEG